MEHPTCRTCPYWDDLGIEGILDCEENLGRCQKYPPILVPGERVKGHTAWEQPLAESWQACGDHPDFPAYIASRKPPGPDLAIPLYKVEGMGTRAKNICSDLDAETLADVAKLRPGAVVVTRNCGETTYEDIRETLARYGVEWPSYRDACRAY